MNNFGTFTKLRPLSLLRHLSSSSETTCLQVSSNSVFWSIYLEQGKIIYATHSVEPFDRLERHLRRLSHHISLLSGETRIQLRMMFEPDSQNQSVEHSNSTEEAIPQEESPEYQAICWLVSQRYLDATQAAVLIQELVQEVIESLLLIKQGTYEFTDILNKLPKICKLDTEKIMERCQERIKIWQSMAPQISSPYQRPYLWIQTKTQPKNLPELQQNLTNWMKGFSLRHLAVIMNQDELQLARTLYPYILNGSILLHEPDPPFDILPKNCEEVLKVTSQLTELTNRKLIDKTVVPSSITPQNSSHIPVANTAIGQRLPQISPPPKENIPEPTAPVNPNPPTDNSRKIYKIVSVDDSPTVLKEISRFLEDESFTVVTISDPVKAVMPIIRHKPDLILLDLNMEGIDGYELCRIIRNNSLFKKTPIIMVTGSKGLVDKVRARLVGASGYLTKPFTRAELLKMVFTHLT
ncbi:MAG: response regulator [Cyanomargarita calcarea GSE-NOS-MK-12-04C]|jgi:twitching motility two-component system response regulator PilG|uniref:Response regulator n=1 Tax=Cyanomargarita calcarea GSE-NOS-MK-12-04C TaxID=2839659 RepID=A0A951URH0_9CYAN|nr:response regulator [Cyanomargarita calcarea GSE-NOS-MK-12-04C]